MVWQSPKANKNQQQISLILQYSFAQKTSFYKSHLSQHYKKYTPTKQPKTLLTLQIFQQVCFWLVSDKTCTISMCSKAASSKHLESKCLYIPVKTFCFKFLFVGWGLNNFLKAARCFYLVKCLRFLIKVFGNSTNFQHSNTSINSIEILKFCRQFGLHG